MDLVHGSGASINAWRTGHSCTIVIHESSMTTGGSVLVRFQVKRAKLDKLERQSQEASEAADRWAGPD